MSMSSADWGVLFMFTVFITFMGYCISKIKP